MPEAFVELDLPSRLDMVTVARIVVAAAASCLDVLDGERLDDLRWVTSEATTNAIQANLLTDRPGRVRVRIGLTEDLVRISVSDEGPGMSDPVVIPEMSDPDRLQLEGGFGIPLMQLLSSSDVVFETTSAGTTVRMELEQ
jgi:anti-sigma regulatory factor (Ser/Thr protein kinase)